MRCLRLPSINKERDVFWLCFGLCLVVCLMIIFLGPPLFGVSQYFGKANDGYIELARSLARGDGYVFEQGGAAVFHRPPLYPVMLVPIAFLPDFLQRPALILLQSALVGLIGVLIFKIAKHLFNVSVARISVGLFLLNPWVYWNAKNPMTAIVQALLYTLFVALVGREFLRLGSNKSVRFGKQIIPRVLCIGACGGALALSHGAMVAVLIIVLFCLSVAAIFRRNYQIASAAVLSGVTAICVIAPWTYRNWVMFDRFIPIAGNSGLAYFNGNSHWKGIAAEPHHKGETHIDASFRAAGIQATEATHTHWKGLKDIELEDEMNKKMVQDVVAHPGLLAKKVFLNAIEYYFPSFACPFRALRRCSFEEVALTVFHMVLWLSGLMAIWRVRDEKKPVHAVLAILAAIVLYAVWYFPFATYIGHSLYTFGTIPFLSILAARGFKTTTRAGIRTCGAN